MTESGEIARIRTHVRNLDAEMEGGIPEGSIVLVCGRPGSMKSSLTYYMMYSQSMKEDRRAMYITLEQGRASLVRHLTHLGMRPDDTDKLAIVDLAVIRRNFGEDGAAGAPSDWLQALSKQIASYKEYVGCDLVTVDSLAALYSLHEFTNPRKELFHFFEELRDLDLTVFLVSEMYDPDRDIFARYEVEDFLADGVLHLKIEKDEGQSNLYLGIVKMRETHHNRNYFPLIVDQDGFEVVTG